ncbi:NAD(P)/FAD-dependent oxidoreductase [Dyella sp.]|uniref:FAD-dependent oxidoreductase n=1 Tax=Dyella sp. TaxID=1869338 RepID=UPI002ED12263
MQGCLRIAIVGYGTAGQAAALFLADQGHELSIFEQAPVLGPVGAGFLLQPTGLGVLDRLGLGDLVLERGQRVDRLFGSTPGGRRVMDMSYGDHAPGCFGLGLTRGSLFDVLRDAYTDVDRIATGTRIESIEGGRELRDVSGRLHGPFDLIVVADGAHSYLREGYADILHRQKLYPWGALWCLLPAEGWPYPDQLQQRYAGTREMIGVLPVGQRSGHQGRWLTFYFSAPGDQLDRFDEQALARMRERVDAIWPEVTPTLATITSPEQIHRARYRDVVLRKPHQGNVVFVGDAAHAMSPQLGQGVNMALLDAQALAHGLATCTSLALALGHYHRRRRRHLAIYQRLSRWLTPWFQSNYSVLSPWRDLTFGPLGRFPLSRQSMLRVLTGTIGHKSEE